MPRRPFADVASATPAGESDELLAAATAIALNASLALPKTEVARAAIEGTSVPIEFVMPYRSGPSQEI